MNELSKNELMEVDGGDVPMAWYTNDQTIKWNGEFVTFFAGIVC
jgi:bacteriocin-like protein